MDIAQLGLVAHLGHEDLSWLKTVKPYQGEAMDLVKLTDKLPAAYIMYDRGNPVAVVPALEFAIHVVSDSKVYGRKSDFTNLSDATRLAKWMAANMTFTDSEDDKWFYLPENFTVETLLITKKHNIITISVTLKSG